MELNRHRSRHLESLASAGAASAGRGWLLLLGVGALQLALAACSSGSPVVADTLDAGIDVPVVCASQMTACLGECVDTQTDSTNCGACGIACSSSQMCSLGVCVIACPSPMTICGASCTNTQTDRANCGICGNVCPGAQTCTAGACGSACAAPMTTCDGSCTNTQTDPANCGSCGEACLSGQVCSVGRCATNCAAPTTTLCGTSCTDTQTDAANCGSCGSACPTSYVCAAAVCVSSCTSPRMMCGAVCIDTQSNVNNCGLCGNACPSADSAHSAFEATTTCTAGTCSITCATGGTLCGTACVNVQNDPSNCGTCGQTCASGQPCVLGACVPRCTSGMTLCGTGSATTCVSTQTDPSNCGACGHVCAAPTGGSAACASGSCSASCPTGQTACSGACINTSTSLSNCGSCGHACPAAPANGSYACTAAACQLTCNTGYVPSGTTCVPACGSYGQPCCTSGTACTTGLACNSESFCGCSSGFACGTACCAFGQICSAGACTTPSATTCIAWNTTARDAGSCAATGTCPRTCLDILASNPSASDGIYTVDPDGSGPLAAMQVLCDMTMDGGGWTLVGYEHAGDPSPASAIGAMAYLHHLTGTPAAVAAGTADGLVGSDFTYAVNYSSARITWCNSGGSSPINRFMLFSTSAELFADTRADTASSEITLSGFTTNDGYLSSLITTPSDARFCRSATSTFNPGDTSWGIKGSADLNFGCGCSSGGWTGVGSYYGGINTTGATSGTNGSSPGQCDICLCWGGGWSGSVTNGQQKGQINVNLTHFWIR